MPIEIRELIVRAIVSSDCSKGDSDKNEGCTDGKEILIAECVEKTLQILKDKAER